MLCLNLIVETGNDGKSRRAGWHREVGSGATGPRRPAENRSRAASRKLVQVVLAGMAPRYRGTGMDRMAVRTLRVGVRANEGGTTVYPVLPVEGGFFCCIIL